MGVLLQWGVSFSVVCCRRAREPKLSAQDSRGLAPSASPRIIPVVSVDKRTSSFSRFGDEVLSMSACAGGWTELLFFLVSHGRFSVSFEPSLLMPAGNVRRFRMDLLGCFVAVGNIDGAQVRRRKRTMYGVSAHIVDF